MNARLLFVAALAMTAVIDAATDTPYVPGRYLGPYYGLSAATQVMSASAAAALCVLGLLIVWGARGGAVAAVGSVRPAGAGGRVAPTVLRALPLVPLVVSLLWTRPNVDPARAWTWSVLAVAAPLALVGLAVRRASALAVAGVAAFAGIALRLLHFARYPIDVGADMLPLTQAAITTFLGGASPYRTYDLPGPLPLTYYPLTWLAYVPAAIARVDLRWVNVVAALVVLAAILRAGRGEAAGDEPGRRGAADRGVAAAVAWSWAFLAPSAIYFDRITTAPVFWAALALTVVAVTSRRRWDWVALGAAGATSPLAAVLAPLVLVTWWRSFGARGGGARTAGAATVAAAVIAPFYLWSPRGFLDGAVLWFNDLSRFPGNKWTLFETWSRYAGFGGLFWRAGAQRWLAPVQWSLVLGVAFLFARRGGRPERLPSHAAAAYVAFMAFNPVHWPYFFQPALVCALLAVAVAGRGPGAQSSAP